MRRSVSATGGSRASSVSSTYRGDGASSIGSDNEGGSSLYEYAPDKALSQLSLNPSPSVDDLLAAGAAANGAASNGKLSPKNGENTSAEGVSSATVGVTAQTPQKTAPKTKLRVKIKRYHAVARWTWNVAGVNPTDSAADDGSTVSSSRQRMSVDFPPDEEEEVCTICQSAFEGTAPGTKFPGDECPVVWGKCGHSFHLSCVSTWLGDKTTCPYCRAEWEFGADQPVDRSDEEEQDDDEEADTSGERSGNTIRRRQQQYPAFEDSSGEEEGQSDGDRDNDEEEAEEEEEDDFWDSDGESYENESEEEESDSEVDGMDDSENEASRSSSPLFGADSSESSEIIGDGGTGTVQGRSYRYATP